MMMANKKQKTATAAAELPLPEDIMVDIVARMPVKSILRFKSASKELGAMVTAPHFITTHLRYATFNNKSAVTAPSSYKRVTGGTLPASVTTHHCAARNSVSTEYDGGVVYRSFQG
ncbi:unnamed protein product [Linum tenue]|uniref:F-box domain-containing protein n=1 Tax=Linum tenue TaxID=586396 RepID=A0AAV0Q944_9ROSI|nr:unnamed protein product [Linum tenue]